LAFVRKYWHLVEAVAAALLKDETISGRDVGDICRRVVRRQHLKSA